jgi:sporulation protein YlmC with PRC-barrel domain
MMTSLEDFIERLDERARAVTGAKEEASMLKVQLDAIRFQKEIYDKKFEHYARLKELKMVDKKSQGQSIIFQNNYFVPRPGQNVEWKDGKPVIEVDPPQIETSKGIQVAHESNTRRK